MRKLEGIIFGIKNIVIIIVAAEFMKSFLSGEKFKKYITVCINIIVVGFIVSQIKNVSFFYDMKYQYPDFSQESYQSALKDEYENQLKAKIKDVFYKEKIIVYDISLSVKDDYTIENITVFINENKKKAEEILKETGILNYEIKTNDQ